MILAFPEILYDPAYVDHWIMDEERPWLPKAKDGAPAELVEAIKDFIDSVEPFAKD